MGRKYAQVRSLAARVDMRTMRLCQWDIFEGLQSAGPRTSLLVAALFHEHVCQGLECEIKCESRFRGMISSRVKNVSNPNPSHIVP